MYLSNKTTIDFIAHHEIQFQSGQGIFELMSRNHDCFLRMGQAINPSGAEIGIMLDHSIFQPNVNKSHYRYLIHMSHDLGDFQIYREEKKYLSSYDLILVPGDIHYLSATTNLKNIPIHKIGFPKWGHSVADFKTDYYLEKKQPTLLYAPSFIHTGEWRKLLPALIKTGYKIIVKNHMYYDFESGAEPPRGSEEEYKEAVESLIEMEQYIRRGFNNVEYIDRRTNLCELFSRSDILITDSSSASLEFFPFGVAIETGRYGKNETDVAQPSPESRDMVLFLPLEKLINILSDHDIFAELWRETMRNKKLKQNNFIEMVPNGPINFTASLIDMYIYLWQNNYHMISSKSSIVDRIKGKWQQFISG